jgi:hypothetical protein
MTTDEDLTPVAKQAVREFRRGERARERSSFLTRFTAVAFAVAVIAFGAYAIVQSSTSSALKLADSQHAAEISSIQDSLKGVCRKVPDPVLDSSQQDACNRAEANVPPAPVVVPGPSGLTTDQVRSIVSAQLSNAPEGLTVPQVTDLVTSLIAKNPGPTGPVGAAGANATTAQVLEVVQQVCANDACKGSPGKAGVNGADAPPASDAQVLSQVQVYCDAHTACTGATGPIGPTGATGDTGKAGRGIVDRTYQRDPNNPLQCQEVTTYSADPSPVILTVGAALCQGLP